MDEATKLLRELVEANDEWAAPATTLEAHEHAQLKYELAQEAARAYLSRAPAEAPPREPTPIQRYRFRTDEKCFATMSEDEDGEYVLYVDHAAIAEGTP